jgi:hypothetical protein
VLLPGEHFCYTALVIPAKNPRVNVVLERPLYEALGRLAHRDGTSLSLKVRDLLREALEAQEDLVLGRAAGERERTFHRASSLSHEQVWRISECQKRP